jgi:hypothetical protein
VSFFDLVVDDFPALDARMCTAFSL